MAATRVIRVGERHDRLTAIEARVLPNTPVLAVCDCGTRVELHLSNWDSTKSCGCLRDERTRAANTTHGGYGTPAYKSWSSMFDRCYRVKSKFYKLYGGRGITVCERWFDFANFLEDMGPRPDGMSIDRVDNDGNYEPSNCRWATQSEQNANQRPRRVNRTKCLQGHDFTPENTLIKKNGSRRCRTCETAYQAAYRAARCDWPVLPAAYGVERLSEWVPS